MITKTPAGKPGTAFTRLSRDAIELTLDRVEIAIRSATKTPGVTAVCLLRAIVDACTPEHSRGPSQLGALPEILGTAVTLQYPLMQLEQFLRAEASDIADAEQAELYLTFARYHLWKLEHLLRESAST